MKTTVLLFISALALTACHSDMVQAPVDAAVKAAPKITSDLNKTAQIGSASRFHCKDDKIVRIVRIKPKSTAKTAKNVETITLTFNNVTEKLKSTVSETGKSYTSIHWRWIERANHTAILTNTQGVVLADVCMEQ